MNRMSACFGPLLVVVWLLFLPIGVVSVEAASGLVDQLYDQGMRYYAGRDFDRAVDYLGQVCDMDDENHTARYYLIYSLAAVKTYDKAMKQARILTEKNPQNEQYRILYDQIRQALQQVEEEQRELRRAVSGPQEVITGGYRPSRSPAAYASAAEALPVEVPSKVVRPVTETDLAISHLDHEEYASATALLEGIIAKNPGNSQAQHLLGVVSFNQRAWERARQGFQKALKIDPTSFQSLFLLGKTFIQEGNLAEAEAAFTKALAQKPDIYAKLHLAEVKQKLGQWSEASTLYQEILVLDPNIPEARLALAEGNIDQGLLEAAAAEVNKVLANDPSSPQARYVRARILFAGDLFDDAAQQVGLALQAAPGNEFYLAFQARCFLKAFQVGKALETAGQLLKINPDNIEARIIMAEGLLSEGLEGDADAHIQIARKAGDDPRLLRLSAQVAAKRGQPEVAREQMAQYVAASPGNGPAYLDFAKFLEESGDISAAIEVYQSIETQFPDSRFSSMAKDKLTKLVATQAPSTPGAPGAKRSTPPSRLGPPPGKVKF